MVMYPKLSAAAQVRPSGDHLQSNIHGTPSSSYWRKEREGRRRENTRIWKTIQGKKEKEHASKQ